MVKILSMPAVEPPRLGDFLGRFGKISAGARSFPDLRHLEALLLDKTEGKWLELAISPLFATTKIMFLRPKCKCNCCEMLKF